MNILIIGATSGIGEALFHKFSNGQNIIGIAGRRVNLLDSLKQTAPQTTITLTVDITARKDIDEGINTFIKEQDHIDIAILCAGTGELNPNLDFSIEKPTLDTNVTGWTYTIDKLYNIFESQGHGHLVAITSAGGLRGEPLAPAYSASKAFQINYMEALRKKAFKNGGKVIVTDIRPGLVNTAMAKGNGLFWVMPKEKVANQIAKTIQKKVSKAYVTKRWHILAVINKNLPFALFKRI